MHLGRDKVQKDFEPRFWLPPGYFAVLNRYRKACAVSRATKHPNQSLLETPCTRPFRRVP